MGHIVGILHSHPVTTEKYYVGFFFLVLLFFAYLMSVFSVHLSVFVWHICVRRFSPTLCLITQIFCRHGHRYEFHSNSWNDKIPYMLFPVSVCLVQIYHIISNRYRRANKFGEEDSCKDKLL